MEQTTVGKQPNTKNPQKENHGCRERKQDN